MASDEMVLVIPARALCDLGSFAGLTTDAQRYDPLIRDASRAEFRPRREVETDPSWLQLIPYVVLRHADLVFHYKRGKAGGETRLHAKRSIGIGGHINPQDTAAGDPYRAGLLRELREEVNLGGPFRESILGFVHDPSTPVGEVHLGVVHVFDLANHDVTPRDAGITECGFAPINELRRDVASFESWSQFALVSLGN